MQIVEEEIAHLRHLWAQSPRAGCDPDLADVLSADLLATIDPFDHVQLAEVVRTCRGSRTRKGLINVADRLRKYLARFNLTWQSITSDLAGN